MAAWERGGPIAGDSSPSALSRSGASARCSAAFLLGRGCRRWRAARCAKWSRASPVTAYPTPCLTAGWQGCPWWG